MELYLLRHGIAEDLVLGRSDSERALTAEGKKKLRQILEVAFNAGLQPTLIVSSPYKRAQQTAELAAKQLAYAGQILESTVLVPHANPQEVWEEIRMHREEARLLLVSHEPLMSATSSLLLNSPGLSVDFKKGAIMRIDLEGFSAHPRGVLKWYLTPRLAA